MSQYLSCLTFVRDRDYSPVRQTKTVVPPVELSTRTWYSSTRYLTTVLRFRLLTYAILRSSRPGTGNCIIPCTWTCTSVLIRTVRSTIHTRIQYIPSFQLWIKWWLTTWQLYSSRPLTPTSWESNCYFLTDRFCDLRMKYTAVTLSNQFGFDSTRRAFLSMHHPETRNDDVISNTSVLGRLSVSHSDYGSFYSQDTHSHTRCAYARACNILMNIWVVVGQWQLGACYILSTPNDRNSGTIESVQEYV